MRFQNTESYWDIQETIKKKPSRKGGNDGCGEVNSATFPIFAWYCHPCQLLNASVSQTCVHLARAPLQQGCGRSGSITLSNTQRLPGTNRDSRIYEVLSGCTMKKKIRHQHCVWLTGRHTAQSMRRTHTTTVGSGVCGHAVLKWYWTTTEKCFISLSFSVDFKCFKGIFILKRAKLRGKHRHIHNHTHRHTQTADYNEESLEGTAGIYNCDRGFLVCI